MKFDSSVALDAQRTQMLREKGVLTADECVYVRGDLLIAENVITAEKRVLGQCADILTESNKRVLKG